MKQFLIILLVVSAVAGLYALSERGWTFGSLQEELHRAISKAHEEIESLQPPPSGLEPSPLFTMLSANTIYVGESHDVDAPPVLLPFIERIKQLKVWKRLGGDEAVQFWIDEMKAEAVAMGALSQEHADAVVPLLLDIPSNLKAVWAIVSPPAVWSPVREGPQANVKLPAAALQLRFGGDVAKRIMVLLNALLESGTIPSSGEAFGVRRDPSGDRIAIGIGDGESLFVPIALARSVDSLQVFVGTRDLTPFRPAIGEPSLDKSPLWLAAAPHLNASPTTVLLFNFSQAVRMIESLLVATSGESGGFSEEQLQAVRQTISQQFKGALGVVGASYLLQPTAHIQRFCQSFESGHATFQTQQRLFDARRKAPYSSAAASLVSAKTLLALSGSIDSLLIAIDELEQAFLPGAAGVTEEDKALVVNTIKELKDGITSLGVRDLGLLLEQGRMPPIPDGALVFGVTPGTDPKKFFDDLTAIYAAGLDRALGMAPPDLLPRLTVDSSGKVTFTLEVSPPVVLTGRFLDKGRVVIATSPEFLESLEKRKDTVSLVGTKDGERILKGATDFVGYLNLKAVAEGVRPMLGFAAAVPQLQELQISAEELSEVIDLLAVEFTFASVTSVVDNGVVCSDTYSEMRRQ